jgi:hypothetical protein
MTSGDSLIFRDYNTHAWEHLIGNPETPEWSWSGCRSGICGTRSHGGASGRETVLTARPGPERVGRWMNVTKPL